MMFSDYNQRHVTCIGWLPSTDELRNILKKGKLMRVKHIGWIPRNERRNGKSLFYEKVWLTFSPDCWWKDKEGKQFTGVVAHLTKTNAMLIRRHFESNIEQNRP